jgi:P4 family phage/plasmid primase-like protien
MATITSFLSKFKSTDDTFTHTRMSGGKYKIPIEKLDKLHAALTKAMEDEEYFDLLERHPEGNSKLLFDLDFQYQKETKREFGAGTIDKLVEIINSSINHYSKKIDQTKLQAFVFIRPKGYTSDKGIYKDGIHIVYPFIEFDYPTQTAIFEMYSNKVKEAGLFDNCKMDKEKIFDRSVITNGWFMYGCTKKGTDPYFLYKVYDSNGELIDHEYSTQELIDILSLRTKRGELIPSNYIKPDRPKKTYSEYSSLTEDVITKVEKLLECLSMKRCDTYDDWFRVGAGLYNTHPDLHDTFNAWSKKSKKYDLEGVDKLWKDLSKGYKGKEPTTFGTVVFFAKEDNPADFEKWDTEYNGGRHTIKAKLQKEAMWDNCHYDYARIIHYECENEFAYSENKWYQFKGHRWNPIKDLDNIVLRKKLDTLLEDFSNERQKQQKKGDSSNEMVKEFEEDNESDPADKNLKDGLNKTYKEKTSNIDKVIRSLKTTGFKSSVITECKSFFYQDKFAEKLDTNPALIGFENGVYDLEKMEFRDGHPMDYISYSTKYPYIPEINQNIRKTLMEKMEQIQPNNKIRDFVITLFATSLLGENRNEIFPCMEGSGGNGKSFTGDMTFYALGDYAGILNKNYLVNEFNSPESHNTMLYDNHKRHILFVEEPPKNKEFNLGFIKEITGGTSIQLRKAHDDTTYTVQPMFKLFCSFNKMPKLEDTNDGGFIRRFVGIKFPNKFVDNPSKPGEFKKDPSLKAVIKTSVEWHQQWFLILLEYFVEYKKNRYQLSIPSEIKQNTNNLLNNQDVVKEFVDNNLEYNKDSQLSTTELYANYQIYHKSNMSDTKPLARKDFLERLIAQYEDNDKVEYREKLKTKKDVFIGLAIKNEYDSD